MEESEASTQQARLGKRAEHIVAQTHVNVTGRDSFEVP